MNIISLILSILMLYGLYYIFKNYDFKIALIFRLVLVIITSLINYKFNILAILFSIVLATIDTFIAHKIYEKSSSFWGFFGGMLLVGLVEILIMAVFMYIIASMLTPY